MAENNIKTRKIVSSKASKQLREDKSAIAKSIAGSALVNAKQNTKAKKK